MNLTRNSQQIYDLIVQCSIDAGENDDVYWTIVGRHMG